MLSSPVEENGTIKPQTKLHTWLWRCNSLSNFRVSSKYLAWIMNCKITLTVTGCIFRIYAFCHIILHNVPSTWSMKTMRGRFKMLEYKMLEYKQHMKQSHIFNQQIYHHKKIFLKSYLWTYMTQLLTAQIQSMFE